jgi:hypothetical protein
VVGLLEPLYEGGPGAGDVQLPSPQLVFQFRQWERVIVWRRRGKRKISCGCFCFFCFLVLRNSGASVGVCFAQRTLFGRHCFYGLWLKAGSRSILLRYLADCLYLISDALRRVNDVGPLLRVCKIQSGVPQLLQALSNFCIDLQIASRQVRRIQPRRKQLLVRRNAKVPRMCGK